MRCIAVIVIDPVPGTDLPGWVTPLHHHFESFESDIDASWLAITSSAGVQLYENFDLVLVSSSGSSSSNLNIALSTIRADFVLWADRGWNFSATQSPFCRMCITVLESDERFSQVKLHDNDNFLYSDRSIYSFLDKVEGRDFYIQSPRKGCGGLTLLPALPAITRMSRILTLGPVREEFELTSLDEVAEFDARSSADCKHLALRSPELTLFKLSVGERYASKEFVIEES